MIFREIARVPLRREARVYEHGWQSWSPAGAYPVTETSPRPTSRRAQTMGYRPGQPAPERGFQGEGLLALDSGDNSGIRLWSAPHPTRRLPSIRLRDEGGRLAVSTDGEVVETVDEGPGGLLGALERWADGLSRRFVPSPVRSLPPVWCSWYHYFNAVREEDVLENLAAIDRLDLDVGVMQVDDGYQAAVGDWLDPARNFGEPVEALARRIKATGRRAGIWVAPLIAVANSRLATNHPDWIVRRAPAGENWGQPLLALDITNRWAAEYLEEVFATFAGWGFDYFKLDFLYAGALEGGRRQDCAPLEAYREALQLIRRAVGPDATLLGCGAPLLPSLGLVDAMRVSPDTAPWYEPLDGDLSSPGQLSAALTGRARAFQHGRFWVNDPDCLIVRPIVENREAWAAHVERFGGLRASSDRLLDLDEWGVETTRRLLKPSSPEPLKLAADL